MWGDRIARALADDLAGHSDQTLINLASVEYFTAVATAKLPGRVLAIDFRDDHDGELRFNTFVAKRARGSMARFVCDHRLDHPEGMKDFADDGYRFDARRSDDDRWVFVRPAGPTARAKPSAKSADRSPGKSAKPSDRTSAKSASTSPGTLSRGSPAQ